MPFKDDALELEYTKRALAGHHESVQSNMNLKDDALLELEQNHARREAAFISRSATENNPRSKGHMIQKQTR